METIVIRVALMVLKNGFSLSHYIYISIHRQNANFFSMYETRSQHKWRSVISVHNSPVKLFSPNIHACTCGYK